MNSTTNSFQYSQNWVIEPAKETRGIVIAKQEWDFLKDQIDELDFEPIFFQNAASILLGAALATFISIVTGAISDSSYKNAILIAWSICAVCTIGGALAAYFAVKEREISRSKAASIITQMKLIEEKFELDEK
jgi:hypothetical protein